MTDLDPITTIIGVPAIVALVNLLKSSISLGRYAALVAVIIGIAISLAVHTWGDQAWFAAAAQGLIFGLGAAGIWDITHDRGEGVQA